MHDLLLRFGFIGCLKSFLEPLETPKMSANGTPVLTLPHSKVRAAVYRALRKLPINTEHPESRDMLKAAEIGRVLSFYAKVRDETPANRRLVQDLLTAWMTPMVEEGRKAMMRPELEARKQEVRAPLPSVPHPAQPHAPLPAAHRTRPGTTMLRACRRSACG